MSEYYLDIETYSKKEKPDFNNDEIIAITYQQFDGRNGEVKGQLNILKSWEFSENEILNKFYRLFNSENKWDFVSVGCNLTGFDLISLGCRWHKMGFKVTSTSLFGDHPYIDLQPILVLMNNCSFKNASLEKFAGKLHGGEKIKEWYEKKDYSSIQDYIEDEVGCFFNFYKFLIQTLPGTWIEFAKKIRTNNIEVKDESSNLLPGQHR